MAPPALFAERLIRPALRRGLRAAQRCSREAARRTSGEPLARQPAVPRPACAASGSRPWRSAMLRGRRRPRAARPSKIASAKPCQVVSRRRRDGRCPTAHRRFVTAGSDVGDGLREVGRGGRAAALIGDHADLVAAFRKPQHGPQEIRPRRRCRPRMCAGSDASDWPRARRLRPRASSGRRR